MPASVSVGGVTIGRVGARAMRAVGSGAGLAYADAAQASAGAMKARGAYAEITEEEMLVVLINTLFKAA